MTPPAWPADPRALKADNRYERTHPVTGETVAVRVLSVTQQGPGVVVQYQRD